MNHCTVCNDMWKQILTQQKILRASTRVWRWLTRTCTRCSSATVARFYRHKWATSSTRTCTRRCSRFLVPIWSRSRSLTSSRSGTGSRAGRWGPPKLEFRRRWIRKMKGKEKVVNFRRLSSCLGKFVDGFY